MIRILLVEDHELIRMGLSIMINKADDMKKAIENAILLLEGNLKEKERAAFTSFATASRMDPGNPEYRNAANNAQRQANRGQHNPYRTYNTGNDCDACTMCQGLICADCCCECIGGDLIRCC